MHADPRPLGVAEAIQHAVVQRDEGAQQAQARVQLHRQTAFCEVDLHVARAGVEGTTNVRLGFADQVFEKRLVRVARNPIGRIEQAQSRRGDHRLLQRAVRMTSGRLGIRRGIGAIAKRPGSQPRQLSRVAVSEGNRDAVRCEVWQSMHRVRREARLGLLAVSDDRRPGRFERPQSCLERPRHRDDRARPVPAVPPQTLPWRR